MTVYRIIGDQSADVGRPKITLPPTNMLAARESSRPSPAMLTPRHTLPSQLPVRRTSPSLASPRDMPKFVSQPRSLNSSSPNSASSIRTEQYSRMYPANVTSTPFLVTQHNSVKQELKIDEKLQCDSSRFQQRQSTEVEPDLEPGPCVEQVSHAQATSARESLGTPLLQDTSTLGQQSVAPPRNTKTCFRALAVLLLWAAAALLGLTVASTVQPTHELQAVTVARPPTPLDFTLRLARAPDRCLGVVDIRAQSQVVLQACSALGTQQFLLLNDGTIRSRSDERLCVTSSPGNKLVLSLCSQSKMQVFNVQPSGKLALKAKPSECLNLLQGNLETGVVGLYKCGGDLNEVFAYGGGHFLVPVLEHELNKVKALPPVNTDPDRMQEKLKTVCGFTVTLLILSALLMMAASPKRRYWCLYGVVFGFIACVIFLICSSLLSAKHAIQESERLTDNAKAVASAQATDLDFTLRLTKATNLCLGAGSLEDKSKVSMQQCKASTVQQFMLQDDGTIRTKQANELCVTAEQGSKMVVLSPCDASKSRSQTFSKKGESHGWLQLQALPSMCLNLLGGNEKAGDIGLYKCGSDLNEVFVYSGGNVAVSELALRVHKVRLLLQQAYSRLAGVLGSMLALGGGGCFLLLAVPSLMLLAGPAVPTSA